MGGRMAAKPRVFVTRMLPQAALDILSEHCDVVLNEQVVALTRAGLIRRIQGKVGLVCLPNDRVDDRVLGSSPSLKIVSNVAVGYDNIDVETATRKKIMVTNTPGVLDETVADFTWALLLAVARRVVEADTFVREGRWTEGWMFMGFLGQDIHGKTLGICGLGRIGQVVARRARGFDMRVLYTQRRRLEKAVERQLRATYVDKETLLREADFVSLHLPLTPETVHYIGEGELNLMKRTAILINVARGPIVDEKALVRALKERRIRGAGLDVFEREPRVEKGLLQLRNVVLAPHIGSASRETRTRMAVVAAQNLVAGVTGRRPPNLVNPEAFVS